MKEVISDALFIRGQESRRKASGQGCYALGSYATQAGLELTVMNLHLLTAWMKVCPAMLSCDICQHHLLIY